jgi:hypothetical protein
LTVNCLEVALQTADREEFEIQLAKLCAGFNVPATSARKEAYWSSLAKMTVVQFARCVDIALSPSGPDDLPTAKGLWRLHWKSRGGGHTFVQTSARPADPDHLAYWANRLLLAHATARGGFGPDELASCLKAKRDLVAWYVGPIREGDELATPAEFLRQWIAGLQEVSKIEPALCARWCEMLERPDMQQPFAPFMGRDLNPEPVQRSLVPA